jgi:anti-sigma B factor antagonist
MNCEDAVPPLELPGQDQSEDCDVQASGELDTATAGPLLRQVEERAVRCQEVVVDLSAVTFMDGAGLDALLAARHTVEHTGGVFRLRSPRPSVRYVLALTDTAGAFDVVD